MRTPWPSTTPSPPNTRCAWPVGALDALLLLDGSWVHTACAIVALNRALAETDES